MVCFLSPAVCREGKPVETHTRESLHGQLEPRPPGRIYARRLRVNSRGGRTLEDARSHGEITKAASNVAGRAAFDGAEKGPRAGLRRGGAARQDSDPHPAPGEAPPSPDPLADWWRQRAYHR